MAAGASSPELFASLVSLFITHSSLGMGTIIGSEIFNQLIICAGAIFAARGERLKLEPTVVMREVVFYGISLIFLLIALSDRRPVEDDEDGYDHVFITVSDGALLFSAYIIYVLVCANYDKLLLWLQPSMIRNDHLYKDFSECQIHSKSKNRKCSITMPAIPFVRQLSKEPRANFDTKDSTKGNAAESIPEIQELFSESMTESYDDCELNENEGNKHEDAFRKNKKSLLSSVKKVAMKSSSRMCTFIVDTDAPRPSQIHGIDTLEQESEGNIIKCFLWQRSTFYNKARLNLKAWQLRRYILDDRCIFSIPDSSNASSSQKIMYPPFESIEVDEAHLLLKINTFGKNRDYIFMAPSRNILHAVVEKCDAIMENQSTDVDEQSRGKPEIASPLNDEGYEDNMVHAQSIPTEVNHSLISFPQNTSGAMILHVILFPWKLFIHIGIPDVRVIIIENTSPKLIKAFIAVIMCIIYLIIGSYAMVASLESIAERLRIPDSVIGVTVSAAGTSLPNYVASQVAARQGLGNMAVSNAFGSNTFNILVGLGLPWLIYTSTIENNYNELRDDGITESVAILAIVLLIFIIIIISTGFELCRWHGFLFIGIYTLFVIYFIGQVFI